MQREIPQGPEPRYMGNNTRKYGAIFDKNTTMLEISLLSLAVYLHPKLIVNLGRSGAGPSWRIGLRHSLAESPGLPRNR